MTEAVQVLAGAVVTIRTLAEARALRPAVPVARRR